MDQQTPISREAHADLEAEILKLETVDRLAIAEKIAAARDDGDLKENAEYHAAKNDQSFLETRILVLRDQLQNSVIVESSGSADEVGFGSTVRLLNVKADKEIEYKIVSSYEQDIGKGLLSNNSPVANAILGAKKNQTVKVMLPNGQSNKFKVLEIS